MDLDLLSLQAVIAGGAILLLVLWHNRRHDKARHKRETAAEADRQTAPSTDDRLPSDL